MTRIWTADMNFLRAVAEYKMVDQKRNEDIRKNWE
jgi:hypothetical protein